MINSCQVRKFRAAIINDDIIKGKSDARVNRARANGCVLYTNGKMVGTSARFITDEQYKYKISLGR